MSTLITDPDVPVGSVSLCRWAFTVDPLTLAEVADLVNDDVLPGNAVPVIPNLVLFDFVLPGAATVTLAGLIVVVDGIQINSEILAGVYNVELPNETAGFYLWRGYGQDGLGNPVGATFWHQYTAG